MISDGFFWENVPLLFLRLDPSGRVRAANRYARDLTGADPGGKAAREILLTFGGCLDLETLRTEPDRLHRFSVATADGLPESFHLLFIPEGDDTLVLGGVDAGGTAGLRRELLTLNNRLNALARELQKKNHELEELNRLKNQFLGMAAHDLRKPVSAVLSYSEFLIDEAGDALSEEQKGFLQIIHASTDSMRRLIDDFLDVSLIESGRFRLDAEETDLGRVVDRSLALNRIGARKKAVTLRVVRDGPIPLLGMDGFKIEQVLNNLIGNAVEHAPPDSCVTIRISPGREGVAVRITDAGPGVSGEEMNRLFAPYERGRARKAPGSRSTGLGLAISRKIVEAHRGKIWMENPPGRGATFGFFLPAATETKGDGI